MLNFSDWAKNENLDLPIVAEEKMRNYGKCTYPANTKQLNVEYPPQLRFLLIGVLFPLNLYFLLYYTKKSTDDTARTV